MLAGLSEVLEMMVNGPGCFCSHGADCVVTLAVSGLANRVVSLMIVLVCMRKDRGRDFKI